MDRAPARQSFQDALFPLADEAAIEEASRFFMEGAATGQPPDFSFIEHLCATALAGESGPLRRAAVVSIYKNIIEPLCDDFSASGADLASRVLARMLTILRQRSEGRVVHELLLRLGFHDEEQLLARYRLIKQRPPFPPALQSAIRKILILSRVTVGADVAITSILIHRLRRSFPAAELIVFGPQHLAELFAGLPDVHWTKVHYQRDGGLVGRLVYFTSLYHLLEKERQGLAAGRTLLVDPDSRLSQLGLLPFIDDHWYCYFPSREFAQDSSHRLSRLANDWLNHLLNEKCQLPPSIAIRPVHQQAVRAFLAGFPDDTAKIVINLGVGNDAGKRLPDPFEEELLSLLLRQDKTLVILDSGCHPEERERATKLMVAMENRGLATARLSEKALTRSHPVFTKGLICVQGGIGMLSALIDQADIFFGYDSCCQHLATARQKRTVICFAGALNDRFFCRWQPLDNAGRTTTVRMTDTDRLSDSDLRRLAGKFSQLIIHNAGLERRLRTDGH